MESANILFWVVAVSTFSIFLSALRRQRSAAQGWILICLGILTMLFFAWMQRKNSLTYLAAIVWILLVVWPLALLTRYNRKIFEQDFAGARRIARMVSILHPLDGWREQPRIIHALELSKNGEIDTAVKMLGEFQNVTSPAAVVAMISLFRITHRWEELLAWTTKQSSAVADDPTFLPTLLRARGEVGDLRGLLDFYEKNRRKISKLSATNSDLCRLVIFAFTGRRDLVERLFSAALAALPEPIKDFWLATADLAAGKIEIARPNFERQLQSADPWNRRAIERRLAKPLPVADLLEPAQVRVVEDAAIEHTHEQMFDVAPPLREAPATRVLIIINLAFFALEILRGGATNPQNLLELGAVAGDLVHQGQWWRLVAALFLHWGALHIAMNMINLSIVGPFVENAFGFDRFVALYFICGVGSMFIVITLSRPGQFTVGASGAIMGLVGATGALMLKGWLHHRAHPARRRLIAVITILALQTFIDSMIPQVSTTAHLSGALIGFATGILLRDKLAGPTS